MAFRNSAPKRVIDPEVPDWAEEDSSGDLLAQKYLTNQPHEPHGQQEVYEKKKATFPEGAGLRSNGGKRRLHVFGRHGRSPSREPGAEDLARVADG